MIKNERQYQVTKAQLGEFEAALIAVGSEPMPAGVHPQLMAAQKEAISSQIEQLRQEVEDYEALKSGKITSFESQGLKELPVLLVKARIARSFTHKQLADRLGVKEQQVQRWEFNDYAGTSLENLTAVAEALDVVLTQRLSVPASVSN